MARKEKVAEAIEEVAPATAMTNEELTELVLKQSAEIASLKKQKGISAEPTKREKFIANRNGWREFSIIELNEDGSFKRVGAFNGKGGVKETALGAMKQAALKAAKKFEDYTDNGDGTYTLNVTEVEFLMSEKYTDFAIPIKCSLEYVEAPKDVEKFKNYSIILKAKIISMGDAVSLDAEKEIKPEPKEKK